MSDKIPDSTELARDFYYLNQFGFTKAPATMDDGGDEKLRRYAAALCNVSGADGNVSKEGLAFIMGYCSCKGYPKSIIDDIPEMCKDAESKSKSDVMGETRELLTMGTLKNTANQIVYDGIRAATQDGLDEKENSAIEGVAEELGVGGGQLAKIFDLVKKEKELRERRIKILFPHGHPCLPSISN
mmetsp:Transcript_10264/g.15549  ORF Transcript_10264/g.15549 Transcript_10264/m.15549 type:complete len:185 (-) Transcript_10264:331-885(-)|eukprot:CAMPEP_0196142722 /NCGR_PEP_ID=MMETSP0910-20130528/12179_1 /TAXON_ID=49265 /ORGANISM="Thalassiosira rotula, Strain GSO102" /LENGTH=184 /DNA_ID=CAMNT_0041404079 /DNA_START=96 /DNA_END=650 /DNA_ORIENTATION=+